ncbi:MAG TPA: roadblock/LC7 domain-containing protein [Candidatus Nanopelagicaceae bacterium]|jgi:predicted regulator of Ras-like GTPase activity (Roadblock/LC7/MglB family)|nr:roadblock/LC7 domain-containing protein [Candidatus Nanopelagicaceae bacterium]
MVDKEVIEKKLAELFDVVPETEGLIASDIEGKVIVGQTITDMDLNGIAKACATLIKSSNALGENTGKGRVKSATLELEDGYGVIVSSDKGILIALAGLDGKASLSLLKRNLISISNL